MGQIILVNRMSHLAYLQSFATNFILTGSQLNFLSISSRKKHIHVSDEKRFRTACFLTTEYRWWEAQIWNALSKASLRYNVDRRIVERVARKLSSIETTDEVLEAVWKTRSCNSGRKGYQMEF